MKYEKKLLKVYNQLIALLCTLVTLSALASDPTKGLPPGAPPSTESDIAKTILELNNLFAASSHFLRLNGGVIAYFYSIEHYDYRSTMLQVRETQKINSKRELREIKDFYIPISSVNLLENTSEGVCLACPHREVTIVDDFDPESVKTSGSNGIFKDEPLDAIVFVFSNNNERGRAYLALKHLVYKVQGTNALIKRSL